MTSTISSSSGPATARPTRSAFCEPAAIHTVTNTTGLEGQHICQASIATLNASQMAEFTTCCEGDIGVEDDCTRYCSTKLDSRGFSDCIQGFLSVPHSVVCENITNTPNSNELPNALCDQTLIRLGENAASKETGLNWASLGTAILVFTALFMS